MIQNQCFVQVGQDRIEKILSSTQYQALREKWSIDLRSIKDSEVVNSSEFEQTMETPSPTGSNSAEDSQRRLPKKRLLKSFHLEEAAEQKEYHCQGNNHYLTSVFFCSSIDICIFIKAEIKSMPL